MDGLYELTGYESGLVIYPNGEALVCNWSNIDGYPRLDPIGYAPMGLGEDIPEVIGVRVDNVCDLLDGIMLIYDANNDDEALPASGILYELPDATIIIFIDWN